MKFAAVPAVTINGETAKVVSGAGSEELKISYIFPKTPAAYDLITNTYSTTDVTATLKAVSYTHLDVYKRQTPRSIRRIWIPSQTMNFMYRRSWRPI